MRTDYGKAGIRMALRRAWWRVMGFLAGIPGVLSIVDRLAGREPETQAEVARKGAKDRLRQSFPEVDVDGRGPLRSARRRHDGC